jgi:hypothetical protein
MAALTTDTLISSIADIVSKEITSAGGIALFVAISAAYVFGQYFILEMVKAKSRESKIRPAHARMLENTVTITQYALTAILVFTVLQIIITSQYNTVLLIASTTISYGVAIFLMAILVWRLLSWFKLKRSLVVLLYGLATILIIINSIDTIILFDNVLLEKSSTITPQSKVIFAVGFEEGTPMNTVLTLQNYSTIGYIFLTWGGTVLLLRHNIKRVGSIKFWILVTLPLVYFTSYYVSLYQELYPSSPVTEAISSNFMMSILLYQSSFLASGLLFGMGFLSISRSISQNKHVRDYMVIAGFGFILFFSAGWTTVLQAAYPPYGLPNVSFVALSYFLILVGLYHSAVSIARDVELRHSIKKSIIKESKLLDSIGSAQMEEEMQAKVVATAKANIGILEKESEIESSLTDVEIQQYIDHVIEELKRTGSDREITNKKK